MKGVTVFAFCAASLAAAVPHDGAQGREKVIAAAQEIDAHVAPAVQPQRAQFFVSHGSKRVKLRYGPYTMPDNRENNMEKMLQGEGGMVDSTEPSLRRPFDGDGYITYMSTNLEYPNGTEANIDSGAWLHHMIMATVGKGRSDPTCGIPGAERFYSSSNDRFTIDMTNNQKDRNGYPLKAGDKIFMMSELMNENPFPVPVYITVTYEWIPGTPTGFRRIKPVWFDVTGCGASSVPTKKTARFDYTMRDWAADFDGQAFSISGHLHDGGTHVETYQNGKLICNAVSRYGGSPRYLQRVGKLAGAQHISSMSHCNDMGPIKKGDKFHIKAYYDTQKHAPLEGVKGKKDAVMGIAILYASLDSVM
jgi:hypothetical protein